MNINPHPDAIKALAACLRCVCGHKRGEDVPDARWILEALEGQFGYTLRRETMTDAELEREALEPIKEACDGLCEETQKDIDTIESALAELEQLRKQSQWQPISSAPRDGSKVVLGRFTNDDDEFNGRCAVDYWHTRPKHPYQGWGQFNATHWPPTHWMPLPTPPADNSEGEK